MSRRLAALLALIASLLATDVAAYAQARKTITIAAVGHIVMGTDFPSEMHFLAPGGGEGLIDGVAPLLRDADIALGNLAAPISTRGTIKLGVDGVRRFAFRTPPRYAPILHTLGLDVVLAANNHVLDFGPLAYNDTIQKLDDMGIAHVGMIDEVYRETIHGVSVAVIGFTQPYRADFQSHHDIEAAAAIVAKVAATADVCVVLMHGGGEGKGQLHVTRGKEYAGQEYRGRIVDFARAAVDAGADLVIGFGAHHPRAMELYHDRLIAYALGNFLTIGPFDLNSPNYLSEVLQVTLDKQGALAEGQVVPLKLKWPGVPSFDEKARALSFLRRMSKSDFPESPLAILPDGTLQVLTPGNPRLVSVQNQ